jgi:hypothetical protein
MATVQFARCASLQQKLMTASGSLGYSRVLQRNLLVAQVSRRGVAQPVELQPAAGGGGGGGGVLRE